MKSKCSVVVIYQDPSIRETAVDFCDHLVQRFWNQCGFEVVWWSFAELAHPLSMREAGRQAKEADLIVVAVPADRRMDPQTQAWLETALGERAEREGALVGLAGADGANQETALATHMYLRKLAHRSALDYLTGVPPDLGYDAVDSSQFCSDRAGRITDVLSEILQQRERRHPRL